MYLHHVTHGEEAPEIVSTRFDAFEPRYMCVGIRFAIFNLIAARRFSRSCQTADRCPTRAHVAPPACPRRGSRATLRHPAPCAQCLHAKRVPKAGRSARSGWRTIFAGCRSHCWELSAAARMRSLHAPCPQERPLSSSSPDRTHCEASSIDQHLPADIPRS